MTSGNKEVYLFPNAYFREGDPASAQLFDFQIPAGWWSRRYEYQWAMTYAGAGQIVADMGMGWHYRPFHDALGMVCEFVYGVDSHPGILDAKEIPPMRNGEFIVADFSKPIPDIKPASLDRIFCISVLEEVFNIADALTEFGRLLKPDGLIVLTLDMPYDNNKPAHEKYKGVKLDNFEKATQAAGLHYAGSVNRVHYDDLLHNEDFNLCVWHCVLKKINHG